MKISTMGIKRFSKAQIETLENPFNYSGISSEQIRFVNPPSVFTEL